VEPKTLDHVAFWVGDREGISAFCERHLGMHVIDRQPTFTLVGADARRGKLTLFDAEPPRQQGALDRVGFRVSDLERARAALPAGTPEAFDIGSGIIATLVEAETDVEYDLDHVRLRSADPAAAANEYLRYGFAPAGPQRVEVGGAYLELVEGDPSAESPLLNHIAVRVASADDVIVGTDEEGLEVESVVDAANTYAAFLRGPDRVRLEYVEHKPTFSLR
jgi:catechol 2,3-dioxygenase-like lactoylglutathione lyase family enzyme